MSDREATAGAAPADGTGSAFHAPVLVREVVDALAGCTEVLDGTLGGGGHAAALLAAAAERHLTGVDRDPRALAVAQDRLARFAREGRFRAVAGNHDEIDAIAGLSGTSFDGILLDLGVSSHQIDAEARGFSFRPGVRLDMRMEAGDGAAVEAGPDASGLLNDAEEAELARIFREYGDEPKARRLAREVVRRRERAPFAISDDLVGAIRAVLGPRSGPADFARLFQAVRIAVNDELGGLARGLVTLRERLRPGGVFAVIAYHSGEDRIVKHAFRDWSTGCTCPPRQPICTCGGVALGEVVTRKAVTASDAEVAANPRARSARLRVWRKARDGEG